MNETDKAVTVEQAQALIVAGKINGFSIGERVYAKRDTYVSSDCEENKGTAKRIPQGLHLLARTFSRSSYGFELPDGKWSGSKKDFATFPDGKVVLSTF